MKSRVETHPGAAKHFTKLELWKSSWSRFFEILKSLATNPRQVFDGLAKGKLPPHTHFVEQLAYISFAIGVAYQPIAHFLHLPHFSLLNWIGDGLSVILELFLVSLLLLVAPLIVTRIRAAFFFLTAKVVGGRGTFQVTRAAADFADAPLIFLGFFLSMGNRWLALATVLSDYLFTLLAMTSIHQRSWGAIVLGQAIGVAALSLIGGLVFYLQKG